MSTKLSGKVTIITGSGSGYGAGIATRFVAEGARVVIADLSGENAKKVAEQLGCSWVQADVTKRLGWEAILKKAISTYGGVDVVVNNAGACYKNKPTLQVQESDFDLCMDVNARAILLSTSVIIPTMLVQNRGGTFIQIASTAADRPRPGLTWYSASKAAAVVATKSLAAEFAPHNIRFNSVCPVVGGTGMTHLFLGKEDTPENREAWLSSIPLGRFCQPADIANACAFLSSDDASFITGIDLKVDGGRCC